MSRCALLVPMFRWRDAHDDSDSNKVRRPYPLGIMIVNMRFDECG